jgi:transposase
MGAILMSRKERRRLELLSRVRDGALKLVKAAELMAVSYRQAKRIWRRYDREGDVGIVHRLRGQRSHRAKPAAQREAVLARYQENYPDFGPTLAAEYLAKEGFVIDHETLRRWLIAAGLRQARRPQRRHRQWRERRAHCGELIQMDGSQHDWFEGRRAPAVLMVMIDDATNRTYARFFEAETTLAAMETFARYSRRYGLPQALYVDLDSIDRTDREPTLQEQLRDQPPVTQFGRAMRELAVHIVPAYSPQAKGRVEKRFLPEINRRFTVMAAAAQDLHRPLGRDCRLDEVLSIQHWRVVAQDGTIRWDNRYFQLLRQKKEASLAGRRILVRQLRDGRVQLLSAGQQLRWKELPTRPQPAAVLPRPNRCIAPRVAPAVNHPWRSFGVARAVNFCRDYATGKRNLNRPPASPLRPPPGEGGRAQPRQHPAATQPAKGTFLSSYRRGHS